MESKSIPGIFDKESLFKRTWKPKSHADNINASISSKYQQFTLFPDLPLELRLVIYELARAVGRVVQLVIKPQPEAATSSTEPVSPTPLVECLSRSTAPALLHACSESRRAGLGPGRYELVFGGYGHGNPDPLPALVSLPRPGPKVYFNFAQDTVHFSSNLIRINNTVRASYIRPINLFEEHVHAEQLQKIRSVAMDFRPSNAALAVGLLTNQRSWLALKVISLDMELFAKATFLAGVEFVGASRHSEVHGKGVQVYGRVFTRDSAGEASIVGKISVPSHLNLAGYGALKMLLHLHGEIDREELLQHVLDCGFSEVHTDQLATSKSGDVEHAGLAY